MSKELIADGKNCRGSFGSSPSSALAVPEDEQDENSTI